MNDLNNRYLNTKIIQESVRGGPAHYRQAHRAPDPQALMARYRAEMKEEKSEVRCRVVCIKLPGIFAIIRLPRWSPIGTPLE
jgi:hypothetical protein